MVKAKAVCFLLIILLTGVLFPVYSGAQNLPSYHKYQGPLKPGVEINQSNFSTYFPELQKMLPPAKLQWYKEGITAGTVTMPIVKTTYPPLSKGVVETTRKNRGIARVGSDNQLIDWIAGVPFPEPRNASEIAWNCYPSINRASAHEDNVFYIWFGLFRGPKYEKSLNWEFYHRKYRGRTDFPPLGDLPLYEKSGVVSKTSIVVLSPHEVKGFIQLMIKYWDINKPDDNYAYIPALRRLRRLTGSDVTDPMLGSDTCFDDFEVWRQKLNSKMTFKVLEYRDFLVPRTYVGKLKVKPPYDYRKLGPFFQVEWETRPLWVLEVMMNDPDYLYSKRVVYVDGVPFEEGGAYTLYWGEQYDQRGRLFKANGTGATADNGKGHRNLYNWMYMNALTGHYTVMDGYPAYVLEDKKINKIFPMDEEKSFTIRGLLRRAR